MDTNYRHSVSIGLPVRNGEKFIRATLDALLQQRFTNYELIISDNASTDKTEQICKEYEKKFLKFTYIKNRTNIGAPKNFNQCFRSSRGEYFAWLPSDDLYLENYLNECVKLLESRPDVVLAHTKCQIIDENDNVIGHDNVHLTFGESSSRLMRLISVIFQDPRASSLLGVHRRSCLCKTSLMRGIFNDDRLLLIEVALFGKIGYVPLFLFQNRSHSGRFSENWVELADKEWMDNDNPFYNKYPLWAWLFASFDILSKLSLTEKCAFCLLISIYAINYFPIWLANRYAGIRYVKTILKKMIYSCLSLRSILNKKVSG